MEQTNMTQDEKYMKQAIKGNSKTGLLSEEKSAIAQVTGTIKNNTERKLHEIYRSTRRRHGRSQPPGIKWDDTTGICQHT